MKRSFYVVPVVFCMAASVVAAQAPTTDKPANYPPATQQPETARPTQQPETGRPTTPPTSAQRPTRPADQSMAGNKVTYSGCIKPGTTTGTWVLENAQVAQKAGSSMPSTVGTSGSKTSFNLDPAANVNLKAHANHKVELVGVLSPAKGHADTTSSAATTPGAAGAAGTPAAGTAGAAGAHAAHQQFSVESVKMVSATCP